MKLTLATRIFIGYAAVLVTFGAVSLFSVAEMHRNLEEIRIVSQGYLHLSQDAAAIETFQKNEARDLVRIFDEKNPETRRALIRLARLYFPPLIGQKIAETRAKAAQMAKAAPASERHFLEELTSMLGDMEARSDSSKKALDDLFTLLARTQPDGPAVAEGRKRLASATVAIERAIRTLHTSLESRIRERVAKAESRERRTGLAILILSVLAIAVGLIATIASARMLRPVRKLIAGVSRIGQGDYSAELGLRGEDEISQLARAFDQMARSLREREHQLREKQAALVQAEKLAAIGRISAQIAHEVRNPLSSIGLNVELLQETFAQSQFATEDAAAESREVLDSVLREVDRLTEITNQYLELARPPKPAAAPEDLNLLMASVLDFTQGELERAHVRVERDLDPKLPQALADEGQLRQVLINLVRNGREAMAGGGTLRVCSRAVNGHEVELEVSDSGEGMSGEVRAHIFEPFFSTKSGGTGLGLAVSRQIVTAHGGTLSCESHLGQGTTFRVRLPRASENAPATAGPLSG